MVGIVHDATFGPVITFGAGGHHVEIFSDRAVSLPPLDSFLARDLIDRTLVVKSLDQFRHFPPADRAALERALVSVSNMVCELPCIKELEINPLILDEHGVVASDVRILMDHNAGSGLNRYAHMAIHPYPAHLCQQWQLADGAVITLRPARPEDAILEQEFVAGMSEESRRFRFMESQQISPSLIVRLNQVDYDREMALLVTIQDDGRERQIGSVRYSQAPDGEAVEFALAIDDAWQKIGLGRRLMQAIMDCARAKSYRTIVGDVLSDNAKMLRLMTSLGFAVLPHPDGYAMKRVVKAMDN
jgi:acetyltransferase